MDFVGIWDIIANDIGDVFHPWKEKHKTSLVCVKRNNGIPEEH